MDGFGGFAVRVIGEGVWEGGGRGWPGLSLRFFGRASSVDLAAPVLASWGILRSLLTLS